MGMHRPGNQKKTKTHNLLEHPEHVAAPQAPRPGAEHERLLPPLAAHRHVAQVPLLLVLGLDRAVLGPRRLPDGLDEDGVPDSQLDVLVLGGDGVRRQVEEGVQVGPPGGVGPPPPPPRPAPPPDPPREYLPRGARAF